MNRSYSGLIPEGKLLIAFSGGEDSLFLLSLASEEARDRSVALYVNHALRPDDELRKEEELNACNARKLGIPLVIVRLVPGEAAQAGEGLEDGARKLRYKALFSYAREHGIDHILTAHHQDDQAETVLMHMLSGAPFYAWSGIRKEDGLLYRPLLMVGKEEIRAEVARRGLKASQDSTNSDRSFLRNRLRHEILPFLSVDSKKLLSSIAGNVNDLRRRYPPIDGGERFFKRFAREDILSSHPVALERTLFSLSLSSGRMTRAFVSDVRKGARRGTGKLQGYGLWIRFTATDVFVYPEMNDFVLEVGEEDIILNNLRVIHQAEDSKTLLFDPALFSPPLILRTSRAGDRIRLRGGWKSVQEMNKDWKIPYSLVLEDREGIAAVFARFLGASDRLSERFLYPSGSPAALAIATL